MDKTQRHALLIERLQDVYEETDLDFCLACVPRPCESHPGMLYAGTAYVVAVAAVLRSVGIEPEAIVREVQKEEPHFRINEWGLDRGFGGCFTAERFVEIATKLLG